MITMRPKSKSDKFLQFENDRACPLCNHAEKVVLSRRMQFGLDCTTVICRNCGFCFVSPPPTREAYQSFYREVYASYYQNIHPESVSEQPLRESAWEKSRLDLIETYKPLKGSKVLEVGPGRGRFLRLVSLRGATACAIEPSGDFRKSLEQSGVQVVGDFLENTSSEQKFDLIMLFQVLEHFHDPVDAVHRLKGLLAAEGVIVLDVPNIWKPFRSLERYFLRYVHLSYFSPQTLKRLFMSQGFEPLHINEGGSAIVSPNQLFAVFHQNTEKKFEINLIQDDWRNLIAHLNRYRKIYPYLYVPQFHLRRLLGMTRRGLANSPIGHIYRHLKTKHPKNR